MKLQVGKRYRRRDGTISPPLEPYLIFYLDPETGFCFDNSPDGNYVSGPSIPYDEDLLAEADE